MFVNASGDALVLETILVVISTVFFLAAVYFSALLSRETKGEKYWVFFLIASFAFGGVHIVSKFGVIGFGLQEIFEIIGAFSLAYACFGLYDSMKKFRKKMGSEL